MDADIAHMALEKNKSPIVISWSGGKDSSLMLQRIQNNDDFKIAELFTIVNNKQAEWVCTASMKTSSELRPDLLD